MVPMALPWHLLASIEAEGDWQMAIDRWLLARAVAGDPRPVLRFYRWSRPTLSLGRHQNGIDPAWSELATAGSLAMVRRPSGGGAVLHAGDLTYALIWPQAPASRRRAYDAASRWLMEGFSRLGLSLGFGTSPAAGRTEHCFSTSTAADLVESGGGKRVGSAQFWLRGCLLQHGSVLMQPPRALWLKVFRAPPPPLEPLPDAVRHWRDLADHLGRVAAGNLPGGGMDALVPMRLSAADWEAIRALKQDP